jgi:hypothetical protein
VSSLVRSDGLCTYQGVWPAGSGGDMGQVATTAVDDLMQMPTALLCEGESADRLSRIGEESAELAACER